MDRIDALEKKIMQAAQEIMSLRNERERLQGELKFLEEENRRLKGLQRDSDTNRDMRKELSARVLRVIKKLNAIKV